MDINTAVCSFCGSLHVCNTSLGCETVANEDGHDVCVVTACVVKDLAYCSTEFVQTAAHVPRVLPGRARVDKHTSSSDVQQGGCRELAGAQDTMEHLFAVVSVYCAELLYGPKWQQCMQVERDKSDARQQSVFLRYLKLFKIQNQGKLPNLELAACAVLNHVPKLRCGLRIPEASRRKLATWCTETILRHILLLQHLQPKLITEIKIRGIVVGLLYQMRNGVVVHGVVVLPRCSMLSNVLPMEIFLGPVFDIRSKCITETENIVKTVLRVVDKERLRQCGVDSIDRCFGI